MNFVEIVLDLINKNGITKNKMLTDLNLSKNSINDWKNRGTIPNGETLSKISEYFNVSTDYLLGTEQKESSSPQLSDKEQELFNDIKSLSPEQQLAIRAVIDSYKNK